MEALVVHGRYSYRIDAIRIAVEVALVPVRSTISTSKDEDRTFPSTAIVDAVYNSLLDQIVRSFHGLSVVWRPPAAAVDRNVLESVIESSCFVDVCYRAREDADACNLRIIGDANSTYVVLLGSDLSSASGTVMIIEVFGCR